MTRSSQVLITFSVLLLGSLGCKFMSGSSADSEVIFAPTEVGTPVSDKASKEIGPAGGSFSSTDGRVTLTVPPNAVSESTKFSIQAISNKAVNGIGSAYRFEPDGKTFAAPVEITGRYDEKDIDGTIPEALMMAFQDKNGSWHAQNSTKLDQSNRTITIRSIHFTDWSWVARVKLSPARSVIRPGDSVAISLVLCAEPGFINRVLSRPVNCDSITMASGDEWALLGPGHLTTVARGNVTYEAPPTKPTPNTATVVYSFDLERWNDNTLERLHKDVASMITILGSSFKASGSDGPVTYSGTICSLDEPFTVTGNHPIFTYPFKFTPTSQTAGTMTYGTSGSGITASGGGTYTIVGRDTETPKIVIQTQSTARSPVVTTSGGGKATITLTPLRDDEGCG